MYKHQSFYWKPIIEYWIMDINNRFIGTAKEVVYYSEAAVVFTRQQDASFKNTLKCNVYTH